MREWLKKIWCPQDTCGALIIVTGLYFTFYNFADILLMQYNPVEWFENVVRNRENPLFAIECLLLIAFLNTAWRCFRELLSEKFSASSIMNRKYYLLPLVAGPPLLWLGARFSGAAETLPDIPLFLMFYCFAAVLIPAAWKTSRKGFTVSFIPPLIYIAVGMDYLGFLPLGIQYALLLFCYLAIVYLLCLLFHRRFPGIARRNFLTLMTIGILAYILIFQNIISGSSLIMSAMRSVRCMERRRNREHWNVSIIMAQCRICLKNSLTFPEILQTEVIFTGFWTRRYGT